MELMIRDLTKQYKDKRAVDGVSLRLTEGINGLLGANGAGKTTLMRMLCGILKPTAGSISLDGVDVTSEDYRAVLGYLPQDFGYYPDFTGLDFLLYLAALKGLSRPHAKRRAGELLELVSLQDVGKKKIKTYSGGMKQRLGIAQALLGNPKVIILDEPTVGLDPIQIIEIRDLIKELGQTHTVIFSSHILSEVQTICDQIIMIAKGKLVAFDTPENLEQHLLTPNEVILTTDTPASEVQTLLEGISNITELSLEEPDSGLVTARIKTGLSDVYQLSRAVFSAFAASGNTLVELAVKKANLEDIFLELADNDAAAPELPAVEGEPVESEVPEE